MMEKLASLVRGGGCTPSCNFTITYKVVVYAPAERADTHSLFLIYPYIYVLCGVGRNKGLSTIHRSSIHFLTCLLRVYCRPLLYLGVTDSSDHGMPRRGKSLLPQCQPVAGRHLGQVSQSSQKSSFRIALKTYLQKKGCSNFMATSDPEAKCKVTDWGIKSTLA
jgi:hypothetical protein